MHADVLEKFNRISALQLVVEKLIVVVLQARIARRIATFAAARAILYQCVGFSEHFFNHAVFIGEPPDVSCAARHIVVNDQRRLLIAKIQATVKVCFRLVRCLHQLLQAKYVGMKHQSSVHL